MVLILDEAHLLSAEQLEELRMLTNAEMDSRATFACLLLGQPTLRRKLRQGVFAALDQRIALRCTIDGMDRKETGEYIAHHVKLAGRSDTLFSDDAVALIHDASRGLPRAVNNLATQTLIAAYATEQVDLRRELRPRRARRDHSRMTGELDLPVRPAAPAPAGQPAAHRAPRRRPAGPRRPTRPPITGCPARSLQKIAPHTEADPVAILTQLLVCCGALIGRGASLPSRSDPASPQRVRGADRRQRKARKGSSFDHVARLLSRRRPGVHRPD